MSTPSQALASSPGKFTLYLFKAKPWEDVKVAMGEPEGEAGGTGKFDKVSNICY